MSTRLRGGTQPAPLALDDVVTAALAVVGRAGLDAITIRSVADELGVTSPAIYHYVRSKEALVERVCERVAALVPLDERPDLAWDDQLVAIVVDMHRTFARYPGVGLRVLTLDGPAPAALGMARRMLTILREAGFAKRDSEKLLAGLHFFFSGWLLGRPAFIPGGGPAMTERLLMDGLHDLLAGFAGRLHP